MNYLKQYEYVITIAEADGISHAAERLNIAQPTLSKYLAKLEMSIGTELFDRSTIPIKLTTAGEYYVETGKRMLDLERQLQKKLMDIRNKKDTVLHIGISPSRSPYLLPPILAQYRKTNPGNRVIIEEGVTGELNEKLASGRLDLMFSLMDGTSEMFEHIHLFDEKIMLAVHRNLAGDSTPQELLESLPVITLGKGQYMRDILQAVVSEPPAGEPVIESQNLETAISFVRAGIGVTLVPSYIAQYGLQEANRDILFLDLPTGTDSRQLGMPDLNRKVCIFYRKEQFLSKAEKDLIQCARECTQRKGGDENDSCNKNTQ